MVGNFFVGATIALLFVSATSANTVITNVVDVGNCSGATIKHVLKPCLQMADEITISPQLAAKNMTDKPNISLRRIMIRIIEGLIMTTDFDLNVTTFSQICRSVGKIYTCLSNTVSNCTNPPSPRVNATLIRDKVRMIKNQLPLTGSGSRKTCDPATGTVATAFRNRLRQISLKACIATIPSMIKFLIMREVRNVGRTEIDRSVQLTAGGKSGKKAKAVCRKLDIVNLLFKMATRCNSKNCNGKSVGGFGQMILRFLGTPGVSNCGKAVKDDESTAETGDKFSKQRVTINFVGLSHIKNPNIGSTFESCILEAGDMTIVRSNALVINATVMKATNAKGEEYTYISKVTVLMFGENKDCGKAGDKPAESLSFGDGITTRTDTNRNVKCGKKNIKIKSLPTKLQGSNRLRVIDQCSGAAMILRSQDVTTLGKVLYLTFRLSKSAEFAGELFTGCTNQVSLSGSRRRKRAVNSELSTLGTSDATKSGQPILSSAALATSDDDTSATESDSEALGGSGANLVCTPFSILVGFIVIMINL